MNLADFKTIAEIIQSIVTTIGLVIAGIWTYTTFVMGRANAVTIRLDLIPQFSFKSGNNYFIVLRFQVQNVGRTRVSNNGCFIAVEEVPLNGGNNIILQRMDSPFDSDHLNKSKVYQVLTRHAFLEPSEQVSEDFILLVEPKSTLRAGLFWSADKASWSSIHIIVPELLEKPEKRNGINIENKGDN